MNGGGGSSGLLQSHALNERDKVGRQVMPLRVAPNWTGQPGKASSPIAGQPAFGSANPDTGLPGRLRQRHVFVEMGPQNGKPLHCQKALALCQGRGYGLCFNGLSHRFNNLCFCTVCRAEHKIGQNAQNPVAKLWCKRYGA
jgi:hypothetical protein